MRLKETFAPRTGWKRGIAYLGLRMKRLPDTPASIALGFSCGVYASFTPFFGFHFFVAAGLAWILRANIFASAIGTFFGNPITFPFIMGACLKLGGLIFGHDDDFGDGLKEMGFLDKVVHLLENIHTLVVPYFVGGLAPGLTCAVVSYFLLKPLVNTFQTRRRARLMERAKARLSQEVAARRRPKPAE